MGRLKNVDRQLLLFIVKGTRPCSRVIHSAQVRYRGKLRKA